MMTKIGADNPDNIYMRANISGKYTYRITGTRGTIPLITFGSRVNRYHIDGTMLQTGDLTPRPRIDQHGRLSSLPAWTSRPKGHGCRFLWTGNLISVRQNYADRRNEVPGELSIECLNPAR